MLFFLSPTLFTGCGSGGGPPGGAELSPTVSISSPQNNQRYAEGETIYFSGTAYDAEDGTLSGDSMIWTSSLNGQIGTGNTVSMKGTSEGTHKITLTARDKDGYSASASLTVIIGNTKPLVNITEPADGDLFESGTLLTFSGNAVDAEDGSIPDDALVWKSDRDGEIGRGSSFSTAGLRGTHIITLEATDRDGGLGSQTIRIQIGADYPKVSIEEPADKSVFEIDETVIFRGSGEGESDGMLSGESLVWISNKDGQIGTGSFFTASELSQGFHTITLVVTDSRNNMRSDAIRISVGNTTPVPRIIRPLTETGFEIGAYISFEGEAEDAEDGVIPGSSLIWSSNEEGEIGSGNTLVLSTLREGEHVITLSAYDSENEKGETQIRIWVGNAEPTAQILLPEKDGTVKFEVGEYIVFQGAGEDPEDESLSGESLVWTSTRNGQIGTGTSFAIRTLSAGVHVITLTATDREGGAGQDSITIYVGNTAPAAEISNPVRNSIFSELDYITFEGTGNDVEDGILTDESLVWSSSINGVMGTGNSLTTNILKPGSHTITLTVTDSNNATGSFTVPLSIRKSDSPLVSITSPENSSAFELNESVIFTGSARSSEGQVLSGDQLSWTSAKDETLTVLGTDTSVTVSNLAKGVHVITLTATDSRGITGKASVTVYIGNEPPLANISNPADGDEYFIGNTVVFNGTGEDPDDGILLGENLVWTSNIDGEIGTGSSLRTNALTEGEHIITLTVTDYTGVSASDAIHILLGNALPVAAIATPKKADGENIIKYEEGQYIVFTGSASDREDGALPGTSLIWTSSIDGRVCQTCDEDDTDCPETCETGPCKCQDNFLTVNNLSAGKHEITLTAVDSDGGLGSDSIIIYVGNVSPTAQILTPEDGATFSNAILFQGLGFDYEDGTLGGASLVWTSDQMEEPIGTGTVLGPVFLPAGKHNITLTVIDSLGASGSQTIAITVISN
ncbi:MAG: hypothetical protein V2I97_14155 [Desulfococcaceae bacterium]|nr:hypothetical protein [Desulfococcaceae bacterium]